MTYAQILIQAYAEASGLSIEEATKHLSCCTIDQLNNSTAKQLEEHQAERLLSGLRKDKAGVLAWGKKREGHKESGLHT